MKPTTEEYRGAHEQTDRELEKLKYRIGVLYRKEGTRLEARLLAFAARAKAQSEAIIKEYKAAETLEEKRKAKAKYRNFYIKLTSSKAFKKLSEVVGNELYKLNTEASDKINAEMPKIYALNYNAMGGDMAKRLPSYNFIPATEAEIEEYSGMDKQTVNKAKDTDWNKDNLKNMVIVGAMVMLPNTQLFKNAAANITRRNLDSAELHANDMTTYAENMGRMDCMHRATDSGYNIQKRWNATLDNRTRPSHRELDKKVIPLDKEFLEGLSMPRDPNGSREEIYGCRCWLTYVDMDIGVESTTRAARSGWVKGTYQLPENFEGTETVNVPYMSYTEWKKWKKRHA